MLSPLSHISDQDLLARLPTARATERTATAQVIASLAEVDRRRLYLAEACTSLQAFCIQRLGYSENEAQKRIQVARLHQRLPQVLTELENGSVHLTGLFLLSSHLTADNVNALLAETRGRTRREIEGIIARWFPRSDIIPSITPMPAANDTTPGMPGNASPRAPSRLQPLSAASYRVEFTASKTLRDKIEQLATCSRMPCPPAISHNSSSAPSTRSSTQKQSAASEPANRDAKLAPARALAMLVA